MIISMYVKREFTQMENEKSMNDRIDGNKIVLYDDSPRIAKTMKTVEIVTPRKRFQYKLKKTGKGKYMLQ
jgi:hypothetical protein